MCGLVTDLSMTFIHHEKVYIKPVLSDHACPTLKEAKGNPQVKTSVNLCNWEAVVCLVPIGWKQ